MAEIVYVRDANGNLVQTTIEDLREDRLEQLEEENKKLKEKLSEITMVADDEKQSIEHILELEKENKRLKEDNRFLTKISKEYMEKENIVEVAEFTQLYKYDLEEENKKLKEKVKRQEGRIANLKDDKKTLELWLDNKEKVNKSLREENEKLKDRIDILYEFIERNDKLVGKVIGEEDLDKLNRYIYIDDDLVDRALESED